MQNALHPVSTGDRQNNESRTVYMNTPSKAHLIAVDCDGTLFDSNAQPSPETIQVVQRLTDAGHTIIAATGRSRLSACSRLRGVPGMRYLVCSNGAYEWDLQSDKLGWEAKIQQDDVTTIVSELRSAFSDVSFGWETSSGLDFEEDFIKLAGGRDQLESGGDGSEPWSQGLYKLYVRRPNVFRLDLQHEVASALGNTPCEISTSGAPFVEITAAGSHKGNGVEKTAAKLGFSAADTIVFGDNQNDLPMFRWAGHAVAMGNALDEVKAAANAVTLENTEHGVAHYLQQQMETGEL